MKRLVLGIVVLMGAMLLLAPMAYAAEVEGEYTRAEAINAVNTLTAAELDALPISGLGPSMADGIVANRPYVVIEDLGIVSGIAVPDGIYYKNILTYFWGADMIPNDEADPDPDPEPEPGVDETASISISAIIAGLTSMSVTDESSDGAVGFGSITSAFQKATEYILVEASSNYGGWGIELYTDNFPLSTPDPADWGYAYGGLVDIANMRKIPLGWCAFDAEDLAGETPANPGDANRWTYVKDKSDVDDPASAANDESWAARGGYCNVAWGVAATGYVVNPNNLASDPIYTDPMNDGNLYVYLETAGTAAPGNYTGSVYFDLYHE